MSGPWRFRTRGLERPGDWRQVRSRHSVGAIQTFRTDVAPPGQCRRIWRFCVVCRFGERLPPRRALQLDACRDESGDDAGNRDQQPHHGIVSGSPRTQELTDAPHQRVIPVAAIKATASASRISAVTSCHRRGPPALWGSNGRSGASSCAGSFCSIRTPRSSKCKGYDRPSEPGMAPTDCPDMRNCQLLRPCPVHLQMAEGWDGCGGNGVAAYCHRQTYLSYLESAASAPRLLASALKFASRFVVCAVKSRKEGCMATSSVSDGFWSAF